jgi:uncharacterized protein UPF0547
LEVERSLERAREGLSQSKLGLALRETWAAANGAVRTRDEEALASSLELAELLKQQTAGRRHREALVLHSYVSSCLDDVRNGVEQQTLLDRLTAWTVKPRMKRCPDCAEKVQAAAKVCRFCGYRFEPRDAGTAP